MIKQKAKAESCRAARSTSEPASLSTILLPFVSILKTGQPHKSVYIKLAKNLLTSSLSYPPLPVLFGTWRVVLGRHYATWTPARSSSPHCPGRLITLCSTGLGVSQPLPLLSSFVSLLLFHLLYSILIPHLPTSFI